MGVIKRQSLKTSIVNYAGVLLGVIFFNFVFPHLIDETYLGLIGLLQNLMFVFASLPLLGLAHTFLRYYSEWKDSTMVEQFNAFSLGAISIALLLFGLSYFLLKDPIIAYYHTHSSLFGPYYWLVIPLVVVLSFTQYIELYSLAKLRVAFPTFLREIVTRVLMIIWLYLFAYAAIDEKMFVYGFSGIYVLVFLCLLIYAIFILKFQAKNAWKFINDNPRWREQLTYSGSMLLLVLFTNLHNFIDGILLPAYLGLGMLGIYMRPLVLGQMIQVPYRAISLISIPIIREAIVANDLRKVYTLNKQIAINLYLIGTFLFALLVINADAIFRLLPAQYIQAKPVLYVIAAGRLLDMAFGLNSEILNYSKYYRIVIYLALLMMVMTVIGNILLIPRMGMVGAALAVSLSLVVFNILKSYFIYQKFHFHCFSRAYITLSFITILVVGVCYIWPYMNLLHGHMFMNALLNIFIKSMVCASLYLLIVLRLRVSNDLNDFVKLLWSGKIFKGGHKMENL